MPPRHSPRAAASGLSSAITSSVSRIGFRVFMGVIPRRPRTGIARHVLAASERKMGSAPYRVLPAARVVSAERSSARPPGLIPGDVLPLMGRYPASSGEIRVGWRICVGSGLQARMPSARKVPARITAKTLKGISRGAEFDGLRPRLGVTLHGMCGRSTLPTDDRLPTRVKDWYTNPTRSRRYASCSVSVIAVTSRPPTRIVPEVGRSSG